MNIVDAEGKRRLAEKVVDLTVMNRAKTFASDSNGPNAALTEKLSLRMREEQTVLYIKHYETEQLNALLDFYNTEIGKSILASQERLSAEMASGVRLVREDSPDKPFFSRQSPPE
ncbi:MAG: DUF2059 domain-containing protein [Pseudohongiella sp.]|nr:DUF2059 domain-containing protein [Pseudohongiella sp.]